VVVDTEENYQAWLQQQQTFTQMMASGEARTANFE
ncbi:MAG: cytochrome-c oxidase, partial [Alphaproteobacteria bacterium]